MSYIFTTIIFQCGGGSSEGVLMKAPSRLELRQYFERSGFEDVEFHDLKAFCEFIESKYYKDGRKVFFQEQVNSHNYTVFSTSPFPGFEREIFTIGEFKQC